MKRHFVFFVFAIVINVLAFVFLFLLYGANHHAAPAPKPIIISTTPFKSEKNTPSNASMLIKTREKAWLNQHYGSRFQLIRSFKAGPNLRGFVVFLKSNPKERTIIYSVNQGQYFFMGTVVNQAGHNISLVNGHQYIQNPLKRQVERELERMPGIVVGDPRAPRVTIVLDPNSALFPAQWNSLVYDMDHRVFSVKWILVNYIKPMGPNTAGAILQAPNPRSALNINAVKYHTRTQTGGYASARKVQSKTQEVLRNHWDFIQKYQLYSLPMTVFKRANEVYLLRGVVMDETLETLLTNNQQNPAAIAGLRHS